MIKQSSIASTLDYIYTNSGGLEIQIGKRNTMKLSDIREGSLNLNEKRVREKNEASRKHLNLTTTLNYN